VKFFSIESWRKFSDLGIAPTIEVIDGKRDWEVRHADQSYFDEVSRSRRRRRHAAPWRERRASSSCLHIREKECASRRAAFSNDDVSAA
jgi:hypothetical protein